MRHLHASIGLFTLCSLVGSVLVVGCGRSPAPGVSTLPQHAATPIPIRDSERYIGASRCAECHPAAHASFSKTGHSRALAEIDLAMEPPDGEFTDPQTQRRYRVYRQDGKLHHAESIQTAADETILLEDQPVRYVIGSGRYSRSYLVERDECLFESPVTWYSAASQWGLSPGYDQVNAGFQRPVELRCLVCHAGRIEAQDRSPQRVTFHALSIDCERCHGPGGAHAEKWSKEPRPSSPDLSEHDSTITNPAALDRSRSEDICAQCHLHSAATVELRGRNVLEFRPGEPLSNYLSHFAKQQTKQQMEVVGHVEQLRSSRCYQSDSSLTCLTCHQLHTEADAVSKRQAYRDSCLKCHSEAGCKLPVETRQRAEPEDDCLACHMPRAPTEIPHFAFTHHRIGIHKAGSPTAQTALARLPLVVLSESPQLHELDRLRNLGLAYLQLSDAPGESTRAMAHRQLAHKLLNEACSQGLKDAEVEAALARLNWGGTAESSAAALRHAAAALDDPRLSPEGYATACYILGTTYYSRNAPEMASPWIERALKVRPTADLWMMFSDCLLAKGDTGGAVAAAERATRAAPDRPRYLEQFLELRRRGDPASVTPTDDRRLQALWKYRRQLDSNSGSTQVRK